MAQDRNLPPEFEAIRETDETILWVARPRLAPFLASGLPFLVGGIAWITFDVVFLFTARKAFSDPRATTFLVPFMLFHAMPFWLSLGNMFRLKLVHGNTVYACSNKRVMLRSGFLGTDFKVIDYDRISDLQVRVGPIEKMFGVGTLRPSSIGGTGNTQIDRMVAIDNPYEVMKKLKEWMSAAKNHAASSSSSS